MDISTIIIIISILVIIEGFFVAFFTKQTKKILTEISKNSGKLRKYGIIELIIGIILLIIGIFIGS